MTRASSTPASRPAPARPRPRNSRKSGVGGTLIGIFVGIALGLGLAAAAAFYVNKAGNPYQSAAPGTAREPGKEPVRGGKGEQAAADKPRFDFYKILPGVEEPKLPAKAPERPAADRPPVERAAVPDKGVARIDEHPAAAPGKAAEPAPRAPKSTERYWLQAGAFSTEGDAENLKAQLALSGVEASVQPATLPDKGVRYRVRLGPYDNIDEVNRIKADLGKRGFDATVIK